MRLLGRKERQRRNPPCQASPAECCQERREFPSGPCHNFSIGRHLWFGPIHSPPQRARGQVGGGVTSHFRVQQGLKRFFGGWSYAVTPGEQSKLHLTTRMVTSSLKPT